MPHSATTPSAAGYKITMPFGMRASIAAMLLFFTVSGVLAYINTRILIDNARNVAHTHEVISGLNGLLSLLKDAETGQRGYVLTGDDTYLQPYSDALAQLETQWSKMQGLVDDNLRQSEQLKNMRVHLDYKLGEMSETIELRRTAGFKAALNIINSDRGKNAMNQLRDITTDMVGLEKEQRTLWLQQSVRSHRIAVVTGVLSSGFGLILTVLVGLMLRRNERQRAQQGWLQSGEVGIAAAITGEQRMERLGEQIVAYFIHYFGAHSGAFFAQDGGEFRRVALQGVPAENRVPLSFKPGESLLGQCVKDGKTLVLTDVPEGYLEVGSSLGQSKPRGLLIAPAMADGAVNSVLELGFFGEVPPLAQQLLSQVNEILGTAVRSAIYRLELQNLLEETQRQSEELQAQSEELKVNNEELEEQSRALKESQLRMEQQQAEMEQTNSQLEEQAQMLASQRDELSRANDIVLTKARELEQASQYKSDFLANMSHELRTPLNSQLILAKLLADNPHGNLTDEQVKFAQTIQSSGNDLLMLINDILDLSKIEAGHMEVRVEAMRVNQMAKDLTRMFEPLAKEKGLDFTISVAKKCPTTLHTDRQRLEQVLKNLLSNALKFTEKGSVKLAIHCEGHDQIAFAVHDTGIGISAEQQRGVFEAFRQADGTISRKYGGTGLGLSISRELARLLGGYIELTSTPGEGSIFMLVIPSTYDPKRVLNKETAAPVATSSPAAAATPKKMAAMTVDDDRASLTSTQRLLLVVEDDAPFARILYDLAHESGFQCLIAGTAEDATILARQYLPHAVVLDVGLPDNSGLSVLDRLKHDPRTRHIPVHVVSGGDHAHTAMALGAVGYMLKPVKREELSQALKKLETKLAQRLSRVLIVEDDPVQRESVCSLLGTRDVQTVAVGSAAECLEKLKNETFDCMVLDLSLPDTSGYNLLETLSQEEAYAFPPVIVYTGRELSEKEEQHLRRYSKSIIIKGAKSPERLLDEVTLFLHQVVAELPPQQQKMIEKARNRDAMLEGRRLLVVEDDIRNIYALTSIFEPHGTQVVIARNGREALERLDASLGDPDARIDLVLMDVMMPEMDGMTATRHIRKNHAFKNLPIIMLTAKAMRDDQERCLAAGANDYMAKPLDVEKLLSLVRVWMPR